MKIVYIVKTQLHFYPPCVSQIRILKKLGVDIEVLYGTSESTALEIFDKETIPYKKICNIAPINNGKLKKIISWTKFRIALKKEMRRYDKNNTIFWFGNVETLIPMKGLLKNKKYIISMLELLEANELKAKLAKNIVRGAIAVTACEETRAYIMKDRWKLKDLPFVFPNKPYEQERKRMLEATSEKTKKIIDEIKGYDCILYQGLIQNTEELMEFAKALKEINKNYLLILMGLDKFNSFQKVKDIYKNTIFIEYVPAPLHLEITSYAKIGICFYRPTVLNNAYCAPNKIYEYSAFGIPMICNQNPGLKNTVGNFGAAECIKLEKKYIVDAITKIDNNYKQYSKNSYAFYDQTDNIKTTIELLKYINFE